MTINFKNPTWYILPLFLIAIFSNFEWQSHKQATLYEEIKLLNMHFNQTLNKIDIRLSIFNKRFIKENPHAYIQVLLKNGQILKVNEIENDHIYLTNKIEQIKKVTIVAQSTKPMYQRVRLLASINTSIPLLNFAIIIFQSLFQISRNLIILGLVTGLLDTFLPFIILSESAIMMGFLDSNKHVLATFYSNIFSSNLDPFNIIRNMFNPTTFSNSNLTFPLLSQYNFNSIIAYNISGQIVITILFLSVTILLKILGAASKSQKIRIINKKVRPMWNCYFVAILPRLATFAGFHVRISLIDNSTFLINMFISSTLFLIMLLFVIQLIYNIRKINSKPEYLLQNKSQIGLLTRINHKKRFIFDCMRFSMLHYPVMNYIRLLAHFIPIGASYDITFGSYGGTFVSQLYMIMIQISCTGYLTKRDKFFFPFNNFLFILSQLCFIAVSLSQSVNHSQVSQIQQAVLFSLFTFIFLTTFISMIVDAVKQLKARCTAKNKDDIEISTENTKRQIKKAQIKQLAKQIKQTQKRSQINSQDDQDYQQINESSMTMAKNSKIPQLKIKKVRKGKVI